MATTDRGSDDHERHAKLAKRARGARADRPVRPYAGSKYQSSAWVPHVYEAELAVFETILASNGTLTNEEVAQAFRRLVWELRNGEPGPLPADAPKMEFAAGREVDYLIWNIRRHWRMLFNDIDLVPSRDLIGILRTLLHALELRVWLTGSSHGYVAFLQEFMQGGLY